MPSKPHAAVSESKYRTQVARAPSAGGAVKISVAAQNHWARNASVVTTAKEIKHRLDPGRGDLEEDPVAAHTPACANAVEISVVALNQRDWTASVAGTASGTTHPVGCRGEAGALLFVIGYRSPRIIRVEALHLLEFLERLRS